MHFKKGMKMTKSVAIANELKEKIELGKIGDGERLPSENELCKEYGVSRITIRSAIQTLAGIGLITTKKGRGSTVSLSSRQKPYDSPESFFAPSRLDKLARVDIFEFRRIIESESAFLAAERADADDIRTLVEINEKMKSASSNKEMVDCELSFHHMIAKATKNPIILGLFEVMGKLYNKMFYQNVELVGYKSVVGHIEIVTAIESREPQSAKELMLAHITKTMQQTAELNRKASGEKQ